MIQDLALRTGDEGLGEGVRAGSPDGGSDASHSIVFPESIKSIGTLAVAYKKAHIEVFFFHSHRSITPLLHHSFGIWMIGGGTTVDLTAAEMDEDENIRIKHSAKRTDALPKKVTGHNRVHVSMNELAYSSVLFSSVRVGSGIRTMAGLHLKETSEHGTRNRAVLLLNAQCGVGRRLAPRISQPAWMNSQNGISEGNATSRVHTRRHQIMAAG